MILSASGGMVYHTRAAFSFDRWKLTRRSVSTLVRKWLNSDEIILIGPSAGYLVDPELFKERKLTVIDPDIAASIIFRARFRKSEIEWHFRSDLLPFTSRQPNAFAEFIAAKPKASILFLGVLGQIDLHKDKFTRLKREATQILLHDLGNRNWASLHDLESTILDFRLKEIPPSIAALKLSAAANAASRIALQAAELSRLGISTGPWLDHETEWLPAPQACIPWLLTQKRLHGLGWVEN